MSYKKWREQCLFACGKHGLNQFDALALLRHASTLQRINEIQCSFEHDEAAMERKKERIKARVRKIHESIAVSGALFTVLEFNGDPRGNPFEFRSDATGKSLSFPGRGLPARCFV